MRRLFSHTLRLLVGRFRGHLVFAWESPECTHLLAIVALICSVVGLIWVVVK